MTTKEWLAQFTEASNERRLYHTDESFMKLRQLQKTIYEDTMDIVNAGSYKAEDGTWVTLPDWNEMFEKSVLYSEPIKLDATKLNTFETQVEVEDIDCLIAGRNLQLLGYNPVILNMASSKNPGGGVINGAGAQEENLFRRSNLFKSMYQFASYAEDYGLERSDCQYPLDRNFGGVYTPNAVVFRGPESAGYPLLKQPHILSFVAVAGLSHPDTINNRLVPDAVAITKDKIRTIFRIALLHGHDSIVLGALGCGAFCNPPAHIAEIFHQVMNESEFKNHFKMLFFAILEDHNSKRKHNPEGNRMPFMREFGLLGNDSADITIPDNVEFKKIKVTAVNVTIKKAITLTIDVKDMAKCKTQDAVKKAIENKILEAKIFRKEDIAKLKYQGRKEVLDEWKSIHDLIVENGESESQVPKEYDLQRFLDAQENAYPEALDEMRNGQKTGHWIWYIFPQNKGLGHSYNSEYYGLDGIEEAKAYLKHPILNQRLHEICEALLDNKGKDIQYIMGGSLDAMKLHSSMEIFNAAAPNDVFAKVLRTFF